MRLLRIVLWLFSDTGVLIASPLITALVDQLVGVVISCSAVTPAIVGPLSHAWSAIWCPEWFLAIVRRLCQWLSDRILRDFLSSSVGGEGHVHAPCLSVGLDNSHKLCKFHGDTFISL